MMKRLLKKAACLAVFASAMALAQEQKSVRYFKDSKEVTEKDDWNEKIVAETSAKGQYITNSMVRWDKEGRRKEEFLAKKIKGKEQGEVTQTEYNYKYGYKEVTMTTIGPDGPAAKKKCLSLEGKLIYADKPCMEDATIDGRQLRQWVSEQADVNLSERSIIRTSFLVRFSPDGPPRVEEVAGKKISELDEPLTEFEEDLIKKIDRMSPEIYRGKLSKALGKEVETLFRIPVQSAVVE